MMRRETEMGSIGPTSLRNPDELQKQASIVSNGNQIEVSSAAQSQLGEQIEEQKQPDEMDKVE